MDANDFIVNPDGADWDTVQFCRDVIFDGSPVTELPRTATWLDVLVQVGIFPSKGQARKNWKGPVDIEPGLTILQAGKKRIEIAVHRVIPEV
jgi:hypothetical protein